MSNLLAVDCHSAKLSCDGAIAFNQNLITFVNVARWEGEEALLTAHSELEKQQAEQGISRLSDWSSRGIKAHIATDRDEIRY